MPFYQHCQTILIVLKAHMGNDSDFGGTGSKPIMKMT